MNCISIPSLALQLPRSGKLTRFPICKTLCMLVIGVVFCSGQMISAPSALAQESMSETVEAPDETPGESAATPEAVEEDLVWSDYNVKAYTLSFWGGNFSQQTYLENDPLTGRTILEDGAGDINGYDGDVLAVSRDTKHYTGATKSIEPNNAYGARIGMYIANDFHLDIVGGYASGTATTTMLYTPEPDLAPDVSERILVDTDPGFQTYKGGLALMFDANSTRIFGIVPRLGFGLGGIINRFSVLPDETAFYLEGSFGLNYEIFDNFQLGGQIDLTTYAFQVDELDYSQIVNYSTYSVGIIWFIDRVPEQVRAAHMAENN